MYKSAYRRIDCSNIEWPRATDSHGRTEPSSNCRRGSHSTVRRSGQPPPHVIFIKTLFGSTIRKTYQFSQCFILLSNTTHPFCHITNDHTHNRIMLYSHIFSHSIRDLKLSPTISSECDSDVNVQKIANQWSTTTHATYHYSRNIGTNNAVKMNTRRIGTTPLTTTFSRCKSPEKFPPPWWRHSRNTSPESGADLATCHPRLWTGHSLTTDSSSRARW